MSGHQPFAPQKRKRRKGRGERESSRGGGQVKVYLHAVADEQAELLTDTVNTFPLKEVKKKTGANVEFDPNPSPVPGKKILIIRGISSQIKAAVSLISQKTGSKETLSQQAQTFWLQWVAAAFSNLDSHPYFLPPVYVNRVPMTRQSVFGEDGRVLETAPEQAGQSNQLPTNSPSGVQDSDVRDNAAMQRIFVCLQKMCEENNDVMVGMTQLQFGHYLGEPCYSAAATHLPLPSSLPPSLPRNWKRGDFDVLLIHRHYGLVVCEVKAFGDNIKYLNKSQQDVESNIKKKLNDAVLQLDKAEAMLSHLMSDVAPGLPITKVIAFPNLTARQLQQAISGDSQLVQDLCRCLGTKNPADITDLCLCSDQLSDPKTPWDVNSHVLRELGNWWQRRVAGAVSDSQNMTLDVYKSLVARFCGPATTVTVPCTSPPRLSVKTLGQAVWATGECYTAEITLFPEQVHLLNTAPPRLFMTGPPGTGKTLLLLMTGIKWLRCGNHVYIIYSSIPGEPPLQRRKPPAQDQSWSHLDNHINQSDTRSSADDTGCLVYKKLHRNQLCVIFRIFGRNRYGLIQKRPAVDGKSCRRNNKSNSPAKQRCNRKSTGLHNGHQKHNKLRKIQKLRRAASLKPAKSSWWRSRAACIMLYHLLLKTVNSQQSAGVSPGQLHLLQYDFIDGKDVEKAVNDLSQAASGGLLYVVADEVVSYYFQTLCDKLLKQVPRLHFWAASYYHGDVPAGWQVEYLTRPLRSPPAVIREVQKDRHITEYRHVQPYSERGVPDHTDGQPVRRLYHRGQGHSADRPVDCVTCGREVASFLHSLRVGVTENLTTTSTTLTCTSDRTPPPCLQWKDVLVL